MDIRLAIPNDISQLVELRMQLFAELGELKELDSNDELKHATFEFFARSFNNNSAKVWVAEIDRDIIATATLVFFIRPPHAKNLSGREAYLLNMFTLPRYRNRGIATALLTQVLNFAATEKLGKVWLDASDSGRPLYEAAGFSYNAANMELIFGGLNKNNYIFS